VEYFETKQIKCGEEISRVECGFEEERLQYFVLPFGEAVQVLRERTKL